MSLFDQWDHMRDELGTYPTYLYDDNPFNDIEYIFNKDVIFGRAYVMENDRHNDGFEPGITSFDEYSRWQEGSIFGLNAVCPNGLSVAENVVEEKYTLTEDEKTRIKENVERNITSAADKYPNVDFYCFYSPYSMAWWCGLYNSGQISKQIEAERYFTELILPHKNIHLFSFNNMIDITSDLNNYKDTTHYASWVSDQLVEWMHDGKYQLTSDNVDEYLEDEYLLHASFDYSSINDQVDYEDDSYAATVLEEIAGR
jgi:hypothetical protein